MNYDNNDIKYDSIPFNGAMSNSNNLQVLNSQYQPPPYFDLNNNNFPNNGTNTFYQSPQTLSIPQQNVAASTNNAPHSLLGPRYSGGNITPNVLMLPPTQNSRANGGSLPDLRFGSAFMNGNNQQAAFSIVPSSASTTQQFFRSSSPQQSGSGELFAMVSNIYLKKKKLDI